MSTPTLLGVASLTSTSVTLVGQVTPLTSASAYATFSYWNQASSATVLTSQVSVPSGPLPYVVMTPETGLTSGATYVFELTFQGQTSSQMTFVAANSTAVPGPNSISNAVMPTDIPHMQWPLTFGSGGVVVCDQDSDADITSCVRSILACTIGEFPEVPAFGIPDITFSQVPIPAERIAQAVMQWEQRATIDAIADTIYRDNDVGTWGMGLTITPQTSN